MAPGYVRSVLWAKTLLLMQMPLLVHHQLMQHSIPHHHHHTTELMKKLDLNFGSLDIVVTKDKRYVFLEVNPNGQYGAVSLSINANVDYEVAAFLMRAG